MDILIAEDEAVSRRSLEAVLQRWGYRVRVAVDGVAAWNELSQGEAPAVAILDWMMPGLDGLSLCRRVRTVPCLHATYLILLTARDTKADLVAALEGGADDYIAKPFDQAELKARLSVGLRMAALQKSLADRVTELEQALARVKLLQGLLPICCYCKRIRQDGNYWQQVEHYLAAHTDAQFSHGICPECFDQVIKQHQLTAGEVGSRQ
jgi:DNA-binding response OmpR family regulator